MKRKFCKNRPGKRALFKKRNHRASNTAGGINLTAYEDGMIGRILAEAIIRSTRTKYGF